MQQKICPYPGLRPFNEEESIFFKGREEQVQRIVRRLGEKKFLMINGASGDGKSSLMFAGVIPHAKAGFFKAEFDKWLVVNFRPERKPLANFATALCTELQLPNKAKIEKELGYGFSALLDLYKASPYYFDATDDKWKLATEAKKKEQKRNAANLLILVDQFEEFFTNAENYHNGSPSNESQKTVNLLLETYKIAVAQKIPVYVVCTMRSDYIGQCAAFRGLPEAIGYSQFFVPRLKRQELEQVIEGPAALSGCKINKSLTQTLLNAAGEGFDQLPILQHALNSIWKVAENGNAQMEKIHLAKVGGLARTALPPEEKALFDSWFAQLPEYKKNLLAKPSLNNVLNAHANELMEFLPEHYTALTGKNLSKEKIEYIVKISFQCLTAIDSGRAVRRRTTLEEITNIINDEKIKTSDVDAVLCIFREQGNTFLQPFVNEQQPETLQLKPETVIDITHESLIRNWTLLNDWAHEEHENFSTWIEVEKQLDRWIESLKLDKFIDRFIDLYARKKSNRFLLAQGPLAFYEDWNKRFNPNGFWLLKYDERKIPREEKINYCKNRITELATFLKKSQKEVKWMRNMAIYFVVMAFSFLGLTILGVNKQKKKALLAEKIAVEQRDLALQKTKEANASKLLAQQEKNNAFVSQKTAEKSEEKALSAKDAAERARHEALSAKANAEQEKIKAEQQTLIATTEAQKAEAQRKIADEAKDKAISAEQKAKQLTLSSLAQNLAFKSTQIEDNTELQGLLALQAYNFTVQNKENVQDPVIYEALRAYYTKYHHPRGILNGSTLGTVFENEAKSMALSKEGNLVTIGSKGWMSIIPKMNPKLRQKINQPLHENKLKNFTLLSPDARMILYGYANKETNLFSISAEGVLINKPILISKDAPITSAVFNQKGDYLAIAKENKTISYGKIDQGNYIELGIINTTHVVSAMSFTFNGSRLFYSQKNELHYFDLEKKRGDFWSFTSMVSSVSFHIGSTQYRVVVGLANGDILINNAFNFEKLNAKHNAPVECITFNSSGTLLATSAADKTILVFDVDIYLNKSYSKVDRDDFLKTHKPIVLKNQNEKIRSLIFTDDTHLAGGGVSKNIWFWDLSSKRIAETICPTIGGNLSLRQWEYYVGEEIEFQKTCDK